MLVAMSGRAADLSGSRYGTHAVIGLKSYRLYHFLYARVHVALLALSQ